MIGETAVSTDYPTYTLSPACDYTPSYTLESQDDSSLSNSFTPQASSFLTEANDRDLWGQYPLAVGVTYEFDGVIHAATEALLTVYLKDPCENDVVSVDSESISKNYIVASPSAKPEL